MTDIVSRASKDGKIFAALPAVMKEVGFVAKTRKNTQQGYSFRGIDDMYQATQLALANNGVCVVPFVVSREREERVRDGGKAMFYVCLVIDHTFYAEDGSFIVARTVGEAMDPGDKSSNKAMSAAMKYALIESLCIATAEPKDTENDSPEVAATPQPAPAPDGPCTDSQKLEASRLFHSKANPINGGKFNAATTAAFLRPILKADPEENDKQVNWTFAQGRITAASMDNVIDALTHLQDLA
jgi:hypothetical protein